MRRRVRLTESDLHRMVNQAVRKILRESNNIEMEPMKRFGKYKDFNVNTFDDPDEELLDIKFKGTYRVTWDIVERLNNYKIKEVDNGQEEIYSKQEAINLFNKVVLRNSKSHANFARTLKIEKLIKTYSGNRWQNVWDASRDYISKHKIIKSFR